jgi:hypothetical protein
MMQYVAMGTPSGVTSADDVSGRRNARRARAVPAAEHHGLTGLFVTPIAGLVLLAWDSRGLPASS